MLNKLGTEIGIFLYKKGYADENEIDAVRYWFEIVCNEYAALLMNIMIGFLIGKGIQTIVYLFVFIFLRARFEGIHCKTVLSCNLVSFGLYFLAIALAEMLPYGIVFTICAASILYLSTSMNSGIRAAKYSAIVILMLLLLLDIFGFRSESIVGMIAAIQVAVLRKGKQKNEITSSIN